ncbi:CPBP family intramembrane metalloprotease [Paenibacillus alba]|uniref:CPBP family intramembrane glutamic endopeptidase n=1 Tax=Paenibacillus alba TaxID=1197127 RepID=UPI001563B884|nr:type II CAAX endopeptidase family protein [Paenibacillus alba]NQX70534.1 CPBP family intramembrane metalloprotease [Paenibacillus alba]
MKTFLKAQASIFIWAKQGKRLTHPALSVLLSFFILLISIVLAELLPLKPVLLSLEQLLSHQPVILSALAKVLSLWLSFVPVYFLLWGWLAGFERRAFWTVGFWRQISLTGYLYGLGSGLLMMGAMVGLAAILDVVHFVPVNGPMEGFRALGGILLVYLGWAVQASAEETLYRGFLLQNLSVRTKPWIGVLLSSLCFACAHSLNNGFSPLVLCNLFLFGLFLALYRIADGSLWGVCAWHTVWNWALANLFGADAGGSAQEGGRLFPISLTGPDWLTGGAFGLEGSLAATAVFLAGIIVAALILYRKHQDCAITTRQVTGD